MQKTTIAMVIGILLLLAAIAAVLLLRGWPSPPSISINEASENAANPYQAEMDCIDRMLQRNDLISNEVEAALAGCRGSGGAANGSSEQ